jgi:hypothetical protein
MRDPRPLILQPAPANPMRSNKTQRFYPTDLAPRV